MAFDATFFAELVAHITNPLDLTTVTSTVDVSQQINYAQGSGAGQADMIWSDNGTIAASSTTALDLAGSLVGPFGTTLTFARVKAIFLRAASGNTNNVNLVYPASNGVPLFLAAGDGYAVKPGGMIALIDPSAAGVVVTAGTGDQLNLVNSGAGSTVSYDIVIIGASS